MKWSKVKAIRSTLENYRIHEKAKRKKIEWHPLNCHLFMTIFFCFAFSSCPPASAAPAI